MTPVANRFSSSSPARTEDRRGAPRAALRLDDNYLADRIAAAIGERLRYCAETETWYLWDGRRWKADRARSVEAAARGVLDHVALEYEAEADRCSDPSKVPTLRGRARAIRSPKAIQIALRGAAGTTKDRAGQRLCVTRDAFDAPAETAALLNCANGVLDLRSGTLSPHEQHKARLITQLCDVDYRPDAQCPQFCAALERIFEADRDAARARSLIDLLQIGLGNTLAGDQRHHVVFLLYGPEGRNGKSFLVQVVMQVLGPDYAGALPPGLLTKRRGESHPTGLADLHRRRFVAGMEFDQGDEFDAALLKQLSGGDAVKARRMCEDFWSFLPTHHLWLGSNYVPSADGGDRAFWSRFRLLPFQRRFLMPGDEGFDAAPLCCRADADLATTIIQHEREGVLAWMVAGARRLAELGNVPHPEASRITLEAVRRQTDPIEAWVEACCETNAARGGEAAAAHASWFSSTQQLGSSYRTWCRANGEQPTTTKALGMRLERMGFPAAKGRGERGRRGLRLRAVGGGR